MPAVGRNAASVDAARAVWGAPASRAWPRRDRRASAPARRGS